MGQRLAVVALASLLAALTALLPRAEAAGPEAYARQVEREQTLQQKAAEKDERAEISDRARERWLQKLERDADPGFEEQLEDLSDSLLDEEFLRDYFDDE